MIKDWNTTNWIWGGGGGGGWTTSKMENKHFTLRLFFCFFLKHLVFKLGRYQNILNGTQPSTTPTALQPYRRMLMALGWV